MNFFEVMLIKPGDEVTVRAIVTESMRWTSIEIDPCISMGNILLHRPTPPKELAVGDRVRLRFLTQDGRPSEIARVDPGEIKHIIGMRAWVDWSSGRQSIHQLPALELDE